MQKVLASQIYSSFPHEHARGVKGKEEEEKEEQEQERKSSREKNALFISCPSPSC